MKNVKGILRGADTATSYLRASSSGRSLQEEAPSTQPCSNLVLDWNWNYRDPCTSSSPSVYISPTVSASPTTTPFPTETPSTAPSTASSTAPSPYTFQARNWLVPGIGFGVFIVILACCAWCCFESIKKDNGASLCKCIGGLLCGILKCLCCFGLCLCETMTEDFTQGCEAAEKSHREMNRHIYPVELQ